MFGERDLAGMGGTEGVNKLKEPVLITNDGPRVLSALPLDADDF